MDLLTELKLNSSNFTPSGLYLFQTIDFNFMVQVDRVIGSIEHHPLSSQSQTDIRQIALQSIHNNIPYFLQEKYNSDVLFSGLNSTDTPTFIVQLRDRLMSLFIANIALSPTSGKVYDTYDIFKAVTPIEYMYSYMPYKPIVTQEIIYNDESEEAMYRRGFLFPISHYKHYMSKHLPLESIRLVRSICRSMINIFSLKSDSELETFIIGLIAEGSVPITAEIDKTGLNKSLQLQIINQMLSKVLIRGSAGFLDVYTIIMELFPGFMG
jgi:hypothetical protein